MLSLAVFLPIVCGLAMFACRGMTHRARQVLTEGVTLVTSLLVLFCLMNKRGVAYTPLYLLPKLPISFCIDGVGSVFAAVALRSCGRWRRCMVLNIWSMKAGRTTSSRFTP